MSDSSSTRQQGPVLFRTSRPFVGIRRQFPAWRTRRWMVPSLLPLLLTPATVRAQSIFVPLSRPPEAQAAQTYFSTNGLTAESILNAAAPDPESRNPLRWGPFAAHPRVDYQYINADGIRQATSTNPSNTVSTIQHIISPGVGIQMGRFWRLDGALAFNYYSDKALDDTFGYNVGINGGIPYRDWTFGVAAGFGSSEYSQSETADQTRQDAYNLSLSAVYGASQRVTYDLGVSQAILLTDNLNDSYSWSTLDWVNYVLTTRTTVGLGVGGGYNMLETGADSFDSTGTDSSFEQLQGRLIWKPQSKLSLSISGGAQFQQFYSDDGINEIEDAINPIWSINAGYQPWDGTSFSVTGSQTIGNSIQADEHTESSFISFGFRQRLVKHLTLSVTPAYSITEYRSNTNPNATANRTDDILSIGVALSTVLFKKVNVSTFFSFADNDSDDPFYQYETKQFGFQLGYRF